MPSNQSFALPRANLRKLRNMTPSKFGDRSRQCRVVTRQYGSGSRLGFQRSRPKYPIWYNEMRAVLVCPSGNRRYTYVRFYGPPTEQSPAWVWCSCEDFGYRLEWVLAQIGCSSLSPGYDDRGPEIINKPPTVRNKSRKAGLCKHLLQTVQLALAQTKDYAGERADAAMRAEQEALAAVKAAKARTGPARPQQPQQPQQPAGQIVTYD